MISATCVRCSGPARHHGYANSQQCGRMALSRPAAPRRRPLDRLHRRPRHGRLRLDALHRVEHGLGTPEHPADLCRGPQRIEVTHGCTA